MSLSKSPNRLEHRIDMQTQDSTRKRKEVKIPYLLSLDPEDSRQQQTTPSRSVKKKSKSRKKRNDQWIPPVSPPPPLQNQQILVMADQISLKARNVKQKK